MLVLDCGGTARGVTQGRGVGTPRSRSPTHTHTHRQTFLSKFHIPPPRDLTLEYGTVITPLALALALPANYPTASSDLFKRL